MIEQKKGHIVAISSMAAECPTAWAILYGTSKSAVSAFMIGLRQQLRLDNHDKYIHTTCVKPYFLQTPAIVDNIQFR
jgi:short-subunit dehydrogenase